MSGRRHRYRDYNFGEAILALRRKIGLTQEGFAQQLGISRRALGAWESGSSYPKIEQLKQLVVLAIEQNAFPRGKEAKEVQALWQASHQRVLLDEDWLNELLTAIPKRATSLVEEEELSTGSNNQPFTFLPFQPTGF